MKNISVIQLDPRMSLDQQPVYDLWIEVTIPGLQNDIDHHWEYSHLPPACKQVVDKVRFQTLMTLLADKDTITLATVRPDSDSLTAMALIKSQLEGRAVNDKLVDLVSIVDAQGPSSIPSELQEDYLKSLYTALTFVCADYKLPLIQRVEIIQQLLEGSVEPALIEAAQKQRQTELDDAQKNNEIIDVVPGKLVIVKGTGRFWMKLGYEKATTVIAMNEKMPVYADGKPTGETYIKYSIWVANESVPTNLDAIKTELLAIEGGRGGTGTILWSPQNLSSALELEQVVQIVQRYL